MTVIKYTVTNNIFCNTAQVLLFRISPISLPQLLLLAVILSGYILMEVVTTSGIVQIFKPSIQQC